MEEISDWPWQRLRILDTAASKLRVWGEGKEAKGIAGKTDLLLMSLQYWISNKPGTLPPPPPSHIVVKTSEVNASKFEVGKIPWSCMSELRER
jgi:hypothetical protein